MPNELVKNFSCMRAALQFSSGSAKYVSSSSVDHLKWKEIIKDIKTNFYPIHEWMHHFPEHVTLVNECITSIYGAGEGGARENLM